MEPTMLEKIDDAMMDRMEETAIKYVLLALAVACLIAFIGVVIMNPALGLGCLAFMAVMEFRDTIKGGQRLEKALRSRFQTTNE